MASSLRMNHVNALFRLLKESHIPSEELTSMEFTTFNELYKADYVRALFDDRPGSNDRYRIISFMETNASARGFTRHYQVRTVAAAAELHVRYVDSLTPQVVTDKTVTA